MSKVLEKIEARILAMEEAYPRRTVEDVIAKDPDLRAFQRDAQIWTKRSILTCVMAGVLDPASAEFKKIINLGRAAGLIPIPVDLLYQGLPEGVSPDDMRKALQALPDKEPLTRFQKFIGAKYAARIEPDNEI